VLFTHAITIMVNIEFIRRLRAAIFAFSCCLGLCSAMGAGPLRVLVVGDSISVGYTDNPNWTVPFEFGFRSGLYTRLTNSGVDVQFVGNSPEPWNGANRKNHGLPANTPSLDLRQLGQDHCEGYSGKKSSYVLKNISSWVAKHRPDVVLLMIGINDIHGAVAEPVATEQNLSNIVLRVTTESAQAHLIVAQITPYGTNCPGVVKYNDYIRKTLVPHFASQGKQVSTVDQYANMLVPGTADIDGKLFSNGINHPNLVVYDRMAVTWYRGIMALDLPLLKNDSTPQQN